MSINKIRLKGDMYLDLETGPSCISLVARGVDMLKGGEVYYYILDFNINTRAIFLHNFLRPYIGIALDEDARIKISIT